MLHQRVKPPPGITKEEWEALETRLNNEQFTGHISDPGSWHISARFLLSAANILGAQIIPADNRDLARVIAGTVKSGPLEGEQLADFNIMSTSGVWIMLHAFAVENLLKGCLAYRLGSELHAGEKRKLKYDFHNLRVLAEHAGLKMEDGDADLLNELTEYVIWRGRYFAPLSAEGLAASQRRLEGKRRLQNGPSRTKAILDPFVRRVFQHHQHERTAKVQRSEMTSELKQPR